ncbi:anhydro-N-acetylmuramic acid kinase [Isoptericola sp. BMS4]|uniref:anhydro-N-acetylmuramic acid kinase n=1 Tax=Isoptericola sp. BMS4 TaxID=2527875 RepID=UPI00141E1C8B|nr:anhydro-N-acetylmuramic acid kinase [Isoptericola sp. BMS4]
MIVIGVSSPAAVDAIGAAAADLDLRSDGTLHLRPLGHAAYPWPDALRRRVLAAMPPARVDVGEVCELDTLVGQELGAAARRAVDDLAGGDADLVASAGQPMHRWVVGGRTRGTLQLGHPAWVAERARRPVVGDFRAADVAAGGQGAPLGSVLDALWLGVEAGDGRRPTAALHLGDTVTVTVVGAAEEAVLCWDAGPGRGYPDVPGPDAGAAGADDALDELTADAVARSLVRDGPAGGVGRVVLTGPGAYRAGLVDRLRAQLPDGTGVVLSDALGLPAGAWEPYLAALLGFLGAHGLPGTAAGPYRRRATGARRPAVLGSLTPPGPLPVALPDVPVRRLVLASSPEALLTSPRGSHR